MTSLAAVFHMYLSNCYFHFMLLTQLGLPGMKSLFPTGNVKKPQQLVQVSVVKLVC